MNRHFRRVAAIAFLAFLFVGTGLAQEAQQSSTPKGTEPTEAVTQPSSGDANSAVGGILAATTEKAAHTAEKWGHALGIGPKTSFSISVGFNFLALFIFCYVLMKSKLPQAFRERTAAIQKGILDAQAASADAAKRLGDIETRLGKLDQEVSAIRAAAEKDVAAEEARIRQAAEEDKQKIVEAAEAEIDAIARNARRELKGYAASLAVDLAGRQMRIDDNTDHALIREFAQQLGKDGK
jgi:F-type H+-transporting ATPase subunit b